MVRGYGKGKFKNPAQRRAVFASLAGKKKFRTFPKKRVKSKPDFDAKKYMKNILENNTFSKNEVKYYLGKSKRKNPHGISTSKWKKVLSNYKPVKHKNEFGKDWWTFEKKAKKKRKKSKLPSSFTHSQGMVYTVKNGLLYEDGNLVRRKILANGSEYKLVKIKGFPIKYGKLKHYNHDFYSNWLSTKLKPFKIKTTVVRRSKGSIWEGKRNFDRSRSKISYVD